MKSASGKAIDIAVRVARAEGLRVDEPVVIRDLTNLLVHLRPSPVVARVQTMTAGVREPRAVLERAIAVTSFLCTEGAPVAGPSTAVAPGPHELNGLYVSFWDLHEHDPDRPLDAAAAGRSLREIHEVLARYPGTLPRLDVIAETREILAPLPAGADVTLMLAALEGLEARLQPLDLPLQAVHGDAHLGNVLRTPAGALWTDWELTHLGPCEWDLAALVIRARMPPAPQSLSELSETAFDGYGSSDPGVVALLVDAYGLYQTAWWLSIAHGGHGANLAGSLEQRLAWWRAAAGDASIV